jgi:membrane-associated phospholipid phosphatase
MAEMKKPELVESIEEADEAAAEAVRPYRETAPIQALSFVSKLGDQPPLRLLCGAMIAAGIVRRDMRMAGAGARALASHTLATWVKDAIKHRIDRTRPNANGNSRIEPGRDRSKDETSFPSGHSAGAAAVASALARDYPEYGGAAYAAAGIVALAQIPRCSHYPSDVGVGIAIGIASDAAVDIALKGAQLAGDGAED